MGQWRIAYRPPDVPLSVPSSRRFLEWLIICGMTLIIHAWPYKYSCHSGQWLQIRVNVPVAHWLRIRADDFSSFNDLSARIVRTSVCHRRSCGTSTCICCLIRGKWLRIRVDVSLDRCCMKAVPAVSVNERGVFDQPCPCSPIVKPLGRHVQ